MSKIEPVSIMRKNGAESLQGIKNANIEELKQYANSKEITTPNGGKLTLKSELRNDEGDPFKVHLDRIIDKNSQYFNHLGGNCVCGKCICGRCKCPKTNMTLDYKKGANSEYQRNYIPHTCQDCAPLLKPDYFASYYNNQPMDLISTNRHDYKAPRAYPSSSVDNNSKKGVNYLPFDGYSTYRMRYLNWGSNPSSTLKPPFHPTVIKDMPFIGKTLYKDNFQGSQIDRDPNEDKLLNNARYGTFRSPLSPDFPFIGETTNQNTYKPFKTNKNNDKYGPKKRNENIPYYDGQFLTTNAKDYDDKGAKKCPAREILNKMARDGVISWTSSKFY